MNQKHTTLSELVKIKKSIEPGSNAYSEDEVNETAAMIFIENETSIHSMEHNQIDMEGLYA